MATIPLASPGQVQTGGPLPQKSIEAATAVGRSMVALGASIAGTGEMMAEIHRRKQQQIAAGQLANEENERRKASDRIAQVAEAYKDTPERIPVEHLRIQQEYMKERTGRVKSEGYLETTLAQDDIRNGEFWTKAEIGVRQHVSTLQVQKASERLKIEAQNLAENDDLAGAFKLIDSDQNMFDFQREKAKQEATEAAAIGSLMRDPNATVAELEKEGGGKYSMLTENKRLGLLRSGRQEINNLHNETVNLLTQGRADGKIYEQPELQKLVDAGRLTPKEMNSFLAQQERALKGLPLTDEQVAQASKANFLINQWERPSDPMQASTEFTQLSSLIAGLPDEMKATAREKLKDTMYPKENSDKVFNVQREYRSRLRLEIALGVFGTPPPKGMIDKMDEEEMMAYASTLSGFNAVYDGLSSYFKAHPEATMQEGQVEYSRLMADYRTQAGLAALKQADLVSSVKAKTIMSPGYQSPWTLSGYGIIRNLTGY